MRVALAVAATSLALLSLGVGLAASLGVTGGDLGAGTAVVGDCDQDGVQVNLALGTGQRIEVIELDGIDTSCAGQQLFVALEDGAGTVLDSFGGLTVLSPQTTVPASSSVQERDVGRVVVTMAP